MVKELVILLIGLAIIFAIIVFMLLKGIKSFKGKTKVRIGVETVGVKTYMELDVQNDSFKSSKKEKE